jgi:hypothetical protein
MPPNPRSSDQRKQVFKGDTMDVLDNILQLLIKALRDPRRETVWEFQKFFWDNERRLEPSIGAEALELLGDLAYDLSFFVADPVMRMEDPSYYGPERLETEIRTVLRRLPELGIAVPNGG